MSAGKCTIRIDRDANWGIKPRYRASVVALTGRPNHWNAHEDIQCIVELANAVPGDVARLLIGEWCYITCGYELEYHQSYEGEWDMDCQFFNVKRLGKIHGKRRTRRQRKPDMLEASQKRRARFKTIGAPRGLGKSTLISDWLRHAGPRVRLSVDHGADLVWVDDSQNHAVDAMSYMLDGLRGQRVTPEEQQALDEVAAITEEQWEGLHISTRTLVGAISIKTAGQDIWASMRNHGGKPDQEVL